MGLTMKFMVSISDEDIELYDKIMTVMYVNKQLNSYNNYYAINRYPEALVFIKGLERYDKYIELATLLGSIVIWTMLKSDPCGVK